MEFKDLNTLLLVVVVILFSCKQNFYEAEGKRWTLLEDEDLELERQLKILNKPPMKTIHTEVGDIYDCIDIYKQPAFDHPLLKNHKIELEPDFFKGSSTIAKVSKNIPEFSKERCPSGTVPIRRTTKEDLVNAKYLSSILTNLSSMPFHYVSVETDGIGRISYYGGAATLNVHNPDVRNDQFNTAQIWIENGPANELNSMQYGWTINPTLYGDNLTRTFGYWTVDGYKKTGCFNTLCPGFVQVSSMTGFGIPIPPSMYGGIQVEMDVMIYRNPKTGNWWLYGEDKTAYGYWPNELFTHLANNASVVKYGGTAGAKLNIPTPPMGNGHFPNDDYEKACYMSQMQVLAENGDPLNDELLIVLQQADTSKYCYDLKYNGDTRKGYGFSMTFGGSGGMCH